MVPEGCTILVMALRKVPNGVAPGATVLGGPDDDVKGPCAFMHGLCAH
eukprot:COSAG02_NODE_56156_length_286_cov_561.320856_1_plen_47_part_01